MNIKIFRQISTLVVLFFLGQQALALRCLAPSDNPFAEANVVFLAQVTKSNKNDVNKKSITAPINIIKIYKGNTGDIKDSTHLYSEDWLGHPAPLVKGTLFLLYDYAGIGDCAFANGQIDPERLEAFEKKHPPTWVRSETP